MANAVKAPYTNYIVTTGDISDFDGFLALPIYKKKAAEMGYTDVVFIMNYPAYFGVPNADRSVGRESYLNGKQETIKFDDLLSTATTDGEKQKLAANKNAYGRLAPGKGYGYSAEELFEFQVTGFPDTFYDQSKTLQEKMKNLAITMCRRIWDSIPGNVDLIFVDGGINEINPFSIDTIKNEFNVYTSALTSRTNASFINSSQFSQHPVTAVKSGKFDSKESVSEWVKTVGDNANIYMDMNGSMAFYELPHVNTGKNTNAKASNANAAGRNTFRSLVLDGRVKSVTIMGGVLADEEVQTLSTTPFLNRFSSGTMNQLYAPKRTAQFFKDIVTRGVPVHVVSNNEINKNFKYTFPQGTELVKQRDSAFNTYKAAMIKQGLLPSTDNIMSQLFTAFYTAKDIKGGDLVPLPFKPFDVLSAWELVKNIPKLQGQLQGQVQQQHITFVPEYGSTIISEKSEKEAITAFVEGGLEKKLCNNKGNSFALPGLVTERCILKAIQFDKGTHPVIDVKVATFINQEDIEGQITAFMKTGTQGGGRKSRKLTKTDERFGRLVVYAGPKGGKYVKQNGEFVALKKLSKK